MGHEARCPYHPDGDKADQRARSRVASDVLEKRKKTAKTDVNIDAEDLMKYAAEHPDEDQDVGEPRDSEIGGAAGPPLNNEQLQIQRQLQKHNNKQQQKHQQKRQQLRAVPRERWKA